MFWKKAGISGINLSLDCIDKDLFREITRGGDIDKVLLGIKLAQKENIPLKNQQCNYAGNKWKRDNSLDWICQW